MSFCVENINSLLFHAINFRPSKSRDKSSGMELLRMSNLGDRIKQLRGPRTQRSLAELLGIPATTLSNYEQNKSELNFAMIDALKRIFSVNTDWLLFGRGPMRTDEAAPLAPDCTSTPQPTPEAPIAAQENVSAVCAELKQEWELERHERRELTAAICKMTSQNHELTSENRNLWKENSELREKCARLEAYQYQHSLNHDGGEAVGSA